MSINLRIAIKVLQMTSNLRITSKFEITSKISPKCRQIYEWRWGTPNYVKSQQDGQNVDKSVNCNEGTPNDVKFLMTIKFEITSKIFSKCRQTYGSDKVSLNDVKCMPAKFEITSKKQLVPYKQDDQKDSGPVPFISVPLSHKF